MQTEVDLFASQPAVSSAVPSRVDFFAASEPVVQPPAKPSNSGPTNINTVDPFATVPLNNFDGSDLFGAFTSNSDSVSTEATQNPTSDSSLNALGVQSSSVSTTQTKKDAFQVKSGIWADSLSRGIIDLNISVRKYILQPPHLNILMLAMLIFNVVYCIASHLLNNIFMYILCCSIL